MIVTLTGSNAFLRSKKLAELRERFGKKYGFENIERIGGESLAVADLPSLLQGGSLFSSNRMIVVRDISQNKEVAEKFIDYLEKTPEEILVVLIEGQIDKRTAFYKALKKSTDFHEFIEPKEFELTKWMGEYAVESGGQIGSSEARLLLEYVGVDQQRLASEIEKLVAYEPKITTDNIKLLIDKRPQATVFQLLEHALSNRKNQAQKILEDLEKGFEDPYQIANLLIWQVQVLAVVKSAGARSDSEIAKDTKFNPYVISKSKHLASSIDHKSLLKIINLCADLGLTLKSSASSPWRLLEHTIISF